MVPEGPSSPQGRASWSHCVKAREEGRRAEGKGLKRIWMHTHAWTELVYRHQELRCWTKASPAPGTQAEVRKLWVLSVAVPNGQAVTTRWGVPTGRAAPTRRVVPTRQAVPMGWAVPTWWAVPTQWAELGLRVGSSYAGWTRVWRGEGSRQALHFLSWKNESGVLDPLLPLLLGRPLFIVSSDTRENIYSLLSLFVFHFCKSQVRAYSSVCHLLKEEIPATWSVGLNYVLKIALFL